MIRQTVSTLVLLALPVSCTHSSASEAETPESLIGGDISFLPELEDHGGTWSDLDGEKDWAGSTTPRSNGIGSWRSWTREGAASWMPPQTHGP